VAASLVTALFAAGPAMAGTLTVDHGSGVITYKAAPGENNTFVATNNGTTDQYRIGDAALDSVPLTEIGDHRCNPMQPAQFRCSQKGLTSLVAALGDGTDSFDDSSISLATTVKADGGVNSIATGGGDDRISVRNGAADKVSCGAGTDSVSADPQDTVAADCEKVDVQKDPTPSPTGTTGSATGDPVTGEPAGSDDTQNAPTVFETPIGVTVSQAAITMPTPGAALVPLTCAATATSGCQGDISIDLPTATRVAPPKRKVHAARGHFIAQQRASKGRRIGRRRFKLAAGEEKALPVRILLRGHYSLVSKRKRSRRAVLRITERDATGKAIDVQTHVVMLKLSRKWSPKRRGR
jgi:hypothetical protein